MLSCVVCEIFWKSTAYVISKFNSKNDIRHCMPHLHTHATLYSMRRLVVPCGYELERIWFYWRFLFQILSESAFWAKRMIIIAKRNNLSMKQLVWVSNWWNTGMQAAMYTDPFCRQWFVLLTHIRKLLEQTDCEHSQSKMIHPWI